MKKAFTLTFCLFLFSCTHINEKPIAVNSSEYSNFGSPFRPKKQLKKTDGKLSVFLRGVDLFQKGELTAARDQFETLNYGEPDFVSGLMEIQKINYIHKDWDRFFGLAVYYRRVLLSNDKLSVSYFRQDLLTLEILALFRHCRFQDSGKIIKWSLALAKRIKKNSSKIKQTKDFLSLSKLFDTQSQHKTKVKWKNQIYWWPLDISQLKQLGNPKNLRIRMDSQC